jgi:hypothetical protein
VNVFISVEEPLHFIIIIRFLKMTEEKEIEKEIQWYIADGGPSPQGPLSLRDIDVKFRTGELKSTHFAWSEQVGGEWKALNDIE